MTVTNFWVVTRTNYSKFYYSSTCQENQYSIMIECNCSAFRMREILPVFLSNSYNYNVVCLSKLSKICFLSVCHFVGFDDLTFREVSPSSSECLERQIIISNDGQTIREKNHVRKLENWKILNHYFLWITKVKNSCIA